MTGWLEAFLRRLFAGPGRLTGQRFVLDGTNIVLLHGRERPDLRYVLALAGHLRRLGAEVDCYFDASTRYIFRDHRPEQLEDFERLTRATRWRQRFHVVPAGTEADQWILRKAKDDGAQVISNDRFRDRARANPWIWKRRHGLRVRDGCLHVPSLELELTVP